MTGDELSPQSLSKSSSHLPQTLTESIHYLEAIVLRQFTQQASQKQLFYHNPEHVHAVKRRSHQIFTTLTPFLPASTDFSRTQLLLDFCAISHDLVQQFESPSTPYTSRRRQSGVNEIATIDQLIQLIHQLNQRLAPQNPARLTESDIAIIRQAIAATICTYDPQEQAIHQPLLYSGEPLSSVAHILALADLGTLGIDGIAAFNREGSLLFLEENPDVVPLLRDGRIHQVETENSSLAENIRQRLLKRSCFQVSFARSRLRRLKPELQGFPEAATPQLIAKTFQHLTLETVEMIEQMTPTDSETPLEPLLTFFQFEPLLAHR